MFKMYLETEQLTKTKMITIEKYRYKTKMMGNRETL